MNEEIKTVEETTEVTEKAPEEVKKTPKKRAPKKTAAETPAQEAPKKKGIACN